MRPVFWNVSFTVLVLGCFVAVLVFLRKGAGVRPGVVGVVGVALTGWLGVSAGLAESGLLTRDLMSLPPPIMRFVVLPALAFVLWLGTARRIGPWLDRVPGDWLVSYQGNRVVVELILHGVFAAGFIHQRLTFAGYNFDIVTGVAGLGVGYLMHKGRAPDWLVVAFNVVGLLLLAIIVAMAALSMPSAFQQFTEAPVLRLPLGVPFVWLPGFIVPLALLAHVLSLRKWLRGRARAARVAA